MLSAITEWTLSQMAAHRAAVVQQSIQRHNDILEGTPIKRMITDTRPQVVELEKMESKRRLPELELRLKEEKEKITYPGVKIVQWDRKTARFKTDLTGWRYLPDISGKKHFNNIATWHKGIDVVLVRGKIKGDRTAYYKSGKMFISVSDRITEEIRNSIEHELWHFAQEILTAAERNYDSPSGLPSKGIQTPQYMQNIKTIKDFKDRQFFRWKTQKLKQEAIKSDAEFAQYIDRVKTDLESAGISFSDFHALDDVEFYSDLIDSVKHFNKYASSDPVDRKSELRVFVGIQEPVGKQRPSKYFNALHKAAPAKWIKAVKEFYKATMKGGNVADVKAARDNNMDIEAITSRVAKSILASKAEKEVERLLKKVLQGTPFSNKAFAVGGYPRDEYMGLDAKDLDIVVSMPDGSEKLTKYLHGLFPDQITTPYQLGAGYPIWQITFKKDINSDGDLYRTEGAVIEFADAMKESFPDPTTRQRMTEPGTLEEDIERRDFTINQLLKDLTTGEILDLTGTSKNDIEKGILRGHPRVSLDKIFAEDPLRMIRAARFYAKYNLKVPMDVLKTIKRNAERIKIVSAERIMAELTKVMKLGKLAQAVRFMKATGLLQYVMPEVQAMVGVKQSPEHHSEGDVFRHSMLVLQNAKPTIEAQLAALLHDVGKPATQQFIGDKIKFLGHDDVGAEMAEAILRRLKFDAETIKHVKTVVENHMRPHTMEDVSEKALRKFIRDLGDELVDAVLDMAEADSLGSLPVENAIPGLRERIRQVKESPVQVSRKPVLNGFEVMAILGIDPKDKTRLKEVGIVGKFLLDLADEYAERGVELTKDVAEKEVRTRFLSS